MKKTLKYLLGLVLILSIISTDVMAADFSHLFYPSGFCFKIFKEPNLIKMSKSSDYYIKEKLEVEDVVKALSDLGFKYIKTETTLPDYDNYKDKVVQIKVGSKYGWAEGDEIDEEARICIRYIKPYITTKNSPELKDVLTGNYNSRL